MLDGPDNGRVISLGSFFKILASGLRLGWVHASPGFVQRFTESGIAAGGGLYHFKSTAAPATLELGWLQENIVNLRQVYGHRMDAVSNALRLQLAD